MCSDFQLVAVVIRAVVDSGYNDVEYLLDEQQLILFEISDR